MPNSISFLITLISVFFINPLPAFSDTPERQTYIVHVDPEHPLFSSQLDDLHTSYASFLTDGESRIVHSFRHVFKGFAARLSPNELKELEKKEGFIWAVPDEEVSLDTTHTPEFLGLNPSAADGFWKRAKYGEGIIIGVMDTGVTPDHPSFSDEGMPAPPAKWKGKCEFNTSTCNNKIIGSRYFTKADLSPLDDLGHGTHTASIAAGSFVRGANVFGIARGMASGIAPRAHLAIYKVCCTTITVLMGMDAAIEDGVDVISMSLSTSSLSFHENPFAIGAYSAMERGILVSCSAGNLGPFQSTVRNSAPWILTVGASTTDRKLLATASLGNGQKFAGESIFQPKHFPNKLRPLVHAGMLNATDPDAMFCNPRSLKRANIRGKVVVCEGASDAANKGRYVKEAGGAAMILINTELRANTIIALAHVLPATIVSYADGLKIKEYINSTAKPRATILFGGAVIGDGHAPVVAAFSSRGPSNESPGILKPDIIGPGVNILAAWPTSIENNTNTKSTFNVLSGTSMSCPHLSGVAALLKSVHPDWSPAVIKSAIMTTADVMNHARRPIEDEQWDRASVFAIGAGHVNPSKANDPGLVYDLQPEDYVPYLCGLNYTNREVGLLLQRRVNCTAESSIPEAQLNYPSFALTFMPGSTSQKYTRTVTNVGDPKSSYTVKISPPKGIDIRVEPSKLEFSETKQKMEYAVTFIRRMSGGNGTVVEGFLKWTSPEHSVRSPIAVTLQ